MAVRERDAYLMDPIDTVRRYAEAWKANDITAVFDLYHDDFVLHYFGDSPLAGDHVGKEAAIEVLVEATQRSGRQLDEIEDVLGGSTFAAIIAREGVGHDPDESSDGCSCTPYGRKARRVLALRRGPAVHRRAVGRTGAVVMTRIASQRRRPRRGGSDRGSCTG